MDNQFDSLLPEENRNLLGIRETVCGSWGILKQSVLVCANVVPGLLMLVVILWSKIRGRTLD